MVEKIREEFMYMDAVNYISDVLQKTKGKELKVAFLGGSLSKGERVKRELCFVSLFEQKIEERLSNGRKVSVLRYGQSGTMSSNGLYKVKKLIEEKPDLVFLDYAMNDTGDRYLWESTEGICSQLVQAGAHVVILLFCNDQGHCTRGAMERVAFSYHLPVVVSPGSSIWKCGRIWSFGFMRGSIRSVSFWRCFPPWCCPSGFRGGGCWLRS